MRWGLIPSWVKDPRKITLMINARSETVEHKPAFKNAMRRRRCLIPADGYYEWQVGGGAQAAAVHLSPRRRACSDSPALAETWIGPNGEELDTVAVVTAPASRDLAVLHHRVPVTIRPEDFARWLDCSSDDAADAMALLAPPEEGEFTWHEVSTRVNHADNDDAQLILPITEEQREAEAAPKPAKRAAPRKARRRPTTGRGVCFNDAARHGGP